MDDELLERCYLAYEMSEFRVIPNPLEILALPLGYLEQLHRFHKTMRFFMDYEKRPPEMKD